VFFFYQAVNADIKDVVDKAVYNLPAFLDSPTDIIVVRNFVSMHIELRTEIKPLGYEDKEDFKTSFWNNYRQVFYGDGIEKIKFNIRRFRPNDVIYDIIEAYRNNSSKYHQFLKDAKIDSKFMQTELRKSIIYYAILNYVLNAERDFKKFDWWSDSFTWPVCMPKHPGF
jgi:hypothetical protein